MRKSRNRHFVQASTSIDCKGDSRSPAAVVRLIVGRLNVGICGEGGRKVEGICAGGSNRAVDSADFVDLGVPANGIEGIENRGRNFGRVCVCVCVCVADGSLISLVSIRIGSFSDKTSVEVMEE